ncbi:hypothetical protein GJAV_G00192030 [Gymnothorax javanicus]|nr:hypothetical protein GJAV_G00192030 [Gymnothorax javanicus]
MNKRKKTKHRDISSTYLSSAKGTGDGLSLRRGCRYSIMLSRLMLVSASALKSSGPLGAGLVQASRSFHTSPQALAPVPPLPEKGGKTRHGIIPEEFFQFLYPKTGVTGPYMLGTGLLLYMLSKEIYVINHETFAAACIGIVVVYGVKKFGPSVAAFADKLNDEKVAKAQEVKDLAVANLTNAIEEEKKEQWRAEGRNMLFDAKRNNVQMLLETNHRERLHMVTNEVKKRLDYQIELQNLHRRLQQEHLVNWVEKSVIGSITPQQEKESIAKCITDLKLLAKSSQAKATDRGTTDRFGNRMYGNSRPFSYDSSDYGGPLQSYGLHRDSPSLPQSSMSRPSGKSIYMQRKEYLESMNRQPDNFQYRVEHLFTCEMDMREIRTLDDCIARLKMLDSKGRVWGQEMILEMRGGNLQLTDIETKGELESLTLGSISQIKAVLDSCVYNSLLTITVNEWRGPGSKVYMFQCEEVGAEDIRDNLEKVAQQRKEDPSDPYRRDQNNIRDNLENIIAQQVPGGFRKPRPPPDVLADSIGPHPNFPPSQWNNLDNNQRASPPPVYFPREDPQYPAVMPPPWRDEPPRQPDPPRPQYTNTQRNVEILNHVLADVENFMAKVSAALPKENSKKKKKKKNKNNDNMPPPGEFFDCLQKIKYGFNLLAKLNGILNNPSAPDFVHILFSTLEFLVPHCPRDLPPSVVVPLFLEQTLQLLSKEVTPEEDKLWISLGDAWNMPRSKWPDGDLLPVYTPTFSDGWQPPPPIMAPPENPPISRINSQRSTLDRRAQNTPEQNSSPWSSPPPRELPQMQVIYDFMARNHQELSVNKGDVVEVMDQSRQWWKVRNRRGEEGYVPQNVLEPLDGGRALGGPQQDRRSPPMLNKMSRPEEVTAWLEYKGFSKITVRTIGALNGTLLLGMSRDELRAVCPEEGGQGVLPTAGSQICPRARQREWAQPL